MIFLLLGIVYVIMPLLALGILFIILLYVFRVFVEAAKLDLYWYIITDHGLMAYYRQMKKDKEQEEARVERFNDRKRDETEKKLKDEINALKSKLSDKNITMPPPIDTFREKEVH